MKIVVFVKTYYLYSIFYLNSISKIEIISF